MIAGPENPTTNGGIGRTKRGTFAKGNKGGPGNPLNKRALAIREALFNAVTPQQFAQATQKIVEQAMKGDVLSYRELANRLIGKPKETVEWTGRNGGKIVIQVQYVRGRSNADD